MRYAGRVLLSLVLAGGQGLAHAALDDLALRQSDAEKQQAALRTRIEVLQKAIDTREAVRKEAADNLRQSESAISRINRRLSELAAGSRKAQTDLQGLEQQITEQQIVLSKRQAELSDQLRAQYASGLSPWTALLSGDDPHELGRNLGYLEYVAQARSKAVMVLRHDIERLAALQGRADARRDELKKMVAEVTEQKSALLREQKERATLLAELEGQIAAQRSEAGKLGRDDQRLSRLIDDLDTAITKQAEEARKAEEARLAAKRRHQEEADRLAQAERQQAAQALRQREAGQAGQAREQVEAAARQAQDKTDVALADPDAAGLRPLTPGSTRLVEPSRVESSGSTGPTSKEIEAETVPQTARTQTAAPPARTAAASANGLQRGLRVPVKGTVQGRFGVDRPDGGVWRGIVLRAAEGTPVKAVAAGTVVYSDWLRGFGNLIIVDHGQQYLTVYAYNQSLLKRVGDPISAGDSIATVGATGGQVESGLYFEIRHRGAPVDPAIWLAL